MSRLIWMHQTILDTNDVESSDLLDAALTILSTMTFEIQPTTAERMAATTLLAMPSRIFVPYRV